MAGDGAAADLGVLGVEFERDPVRRPLVHARIHSIRATTTAAGVAVGWWRGAEERSARPSSPNWR